eukprot:scaffold32506_cov61-Phaeocystis_antarctica.AAC.2
MSAPTTPDTARAVPRTQTHFRRAGSEADERREGEAPVPFPSDAYYHPNLPPKLGLFGAQGQDGRIPWRPRLKLGQKVCCRHVAVVLHNDALNRILLAGLHP